MNLMKRRIIALAMSLSMMSALIVTGAEDEWADWDSENPYPEDIMGTIYYVPVKSLMDRKAISGYPDKTYRPNEHMSRADFAAVLAKATNNISDAGVASKFDDLKGLPNSYDSYINGIVNNGIMSGKGNRKFAPYDTISYAEVITAVIRAKNDGNVQYAEDLGSWPTNYITYAEIYNLLSDVVINDWNAPATRGDIAMLIYRNTPKGSSSGGNVTVTATSTIIPVGGSVNFFASTSSSGGTKQYKWYVNNNLLGQYTERFGYTFTAPGNYTIKAEITTSEIGKTSTTATGTIMVTVQ